MKKLIFILILLQSIGTYAQKQEIFKQNIKGIIRLMKLSQKSKKEKSVF